MDCELKSESVGGQAVAQLGVEEERECVIRGFTIGRLIPQLPHVV